MKAAVFVVPSRLSGIAVATSGRDCGSGYARTIAQITVLGANQPCAYKVEAACAVHPSLIEPRRVRTPYLDNLLYVRQSSDYSAIAGGLSLLVPDTRDVASGK